MAQRTLPQKPRAIYAETVALARALRHAFLMDAKDKASQSFSQTKAAQVLYWLLGMIAVVVGLFVGAAALAADIDASKTPAEWRAEAAHERDIQDAINRAAIRRSVSEYNAAHPTIEATVWALRPQ